MNIVTTECLQIGLPLKHERYGARRVSLRLASLPKGLYGKLLPESWMKSLPLVILLMLLTVGCGQNVSDARVEAYENWDRVRAETICAQALENLRLGQLEQACKRAREALALDEDYHDARIVLAKACIERGQYTAATVQLQQVLRERPGEAEALYLLGVAHEKLGRLTEALGDYRGAYDLDDTNFDAVLAATEVLVAMDRPHDARVYLYSHLDRADGAPAAYELAGRLAMMNKDYAAAVGHFRRACEVDVDNPTYLEALAVAQVFDGRVTEAIVTLTRRAELHGEPAPGWLYAMLGDCHMACGDLDMAYEAYQKDCQLEPDEPSAWVNLGKLLVTMHRTPQAIDAAAKALSLDADRLDASLLMGYALIEAGYADQAIDVLRRAAGRHGQDPTLLCVLGRAYEATDNMIEAHRCYVAATRADPNDLLAPALLADVSASSTEPAE